MLLKYIKKPNGAFNQVPTDQATEWVNKLCKPSNSIIGITKTDSARDLVCITWGERAIISEATKYLLSIGDEDESLTTRKDNFLSRTSKDKADVKSLVEKFERFGIFSVCRPKVAAIDEVNTEEASASGHLLSLTTNDVATEDFEDALLTANTCGAQLVRKYVSTRIVEKNIPFLAPMMRQNSKTFSSLYKSVVNTTGNVKKIVKADRRLMQR